MKNNQKNKKQSPVKKKNNYKIYFLYILIPVAIILLSKAFDSSTQSSLIRDNGHNHDHEGHVHEYQNNPELKLNYPVIK